MERTEDIMRSLLKIAALLLAALCIFTSCARDTEQTETLPEGITTGSSATTGEETTEAPLSTGTSAIPEIPDFTSPELTEETVDIDFDSDRIEPDRDIRAPYAILVDVEKKTVLYSKGGENEKIYPASITKVLTALVALQNCDPEVVFTPGDELELVEYDASIAYIKSHHSLTLDMLIEGMMLPSGGDAAYVIAAGVGRIILGSTEATAFECVDEFVREMNRYAKSIGMNDSNFVTPDGYHHDDHYTTLHDVALLGMEALKSEIIMKYANTYYDNVTYASGHTNEWSNSNMLINPHSEHYYKYATGLKTGTTDEAGACLLASAEHDGRSVIVGVFASTSNTSRFNDARSLLETGLEWALRH